MSAAAYPYATLEYAATLAHVGRPLFVSPWQTYVIARDLDESTADAAGPYPVTCLPADADLAAGLAELRAARLVSVTLIPDALRGPSTEQLQSVFSLVREFKTHYLIDPEVGPYQASRHHRYEIRRAAKVGVTTRDVDLAEILDEWTMLYENLITTHRIGGVQRFSRQSFSLLARCPGLSACAAYIDDELVSCHLWFEYEGCVWSHLAASSDLGYATAASYAVYEHSLQRFAGRLVDLGGAAGNADSADAGLARLKAGFANRTQNAYLCGEVLDDAAYRRLCARHQRTTKDYFPAYRAP